MRRVEPGRGYPLAAALAAGLLVAAGIVLALRYAGPQTDGQGLDGERNAATYFSALVLLAGSAAAARYARVPRGPLRPAPLGFAALLLLMGLDEAFTIHETIERAAGIDWQLLYAPVLLAGAVAGLGVAGALRRDGLALGLLAGGAAAWAVSQLLEALQWDGDRLVVPALIYYEELLELAGSGLFLLAMLTALAREAVGGRTRLRRP